MVRWILAILITVGAAYYQRVTGPTYPVEENVSIGGRLVHVVLTRAHGGEGGQPLEIEGLGPGVEGRIVWRRYPTSEPFRTIAMERTGDRLAGSLPHQRPAGKLEYRIELVDASEVARLPAEGTVVTRFKGAVPPGVLVPHILLMFTAMLFANRTGLEALRGGMRLRTYALWTVALLVAGGMILGPVVQKFAFGAYWTGVPFGYDLTDNKTLIAVAGWFLALRRARKSRSARWWIFGAAILTFAIYMIPHSTLGSELKYE